MMLTHRRTALIVPLLFLAGCAADADLVQVGNVFLSYVRGSKVKVTREQAEAIPFATMGLELGPSPQALLTLGAVSQEQLSWYAGEQVFVATRRGRVLRTAGLPYDLGGLSVLSESSAGGDLKAGDPSILLSLDFPDLGVFGATAECASRDAGDDPVEIFGASIPTHRIVEHCTVPAMKWRYDNEFWEDPTTGYVWRSRQHIHPKSPPVVLEVFRPEEGASG